MKRSVNFEVHTQWWKQTLRFSPIFSNFQQASIYQEYWFAMAPNPLQIQKGDTNNQTYFFLLAFFAAFFSLGVNKASFFTAFFESLPFAIIYFLLKYTQTPQFLPSALWLVPYFLYPRNLKLNILVLVVNLIQKQHQLPQKHPVVNCQC